MVLVLLILTLALALALSSFLALTLGPLPRTDFVSVIPEPFLLVPARAPPATALVTVLSLALMLALMLALASERPAGMQARAVAAWRLEALALLALALAQEHASTWVTSSKF